ncbi:putative bifunctional diguanylate cyclase/phosphodiesterase [Micromonospora endolithica]|uniref:putative bifunctional diguanylate cyclase/phosphodiesterase n=1 Tax=Micromonospora endolithica TaxID=230091 RepID=UPI0013151D4D|nr:EAL domain-containing protein [Micromonospora endolithica]
MLGLLLASSLIAAAAYPFVVGPSGVALYIGAATQATMLLAGARRLAMSGRHDAPAMWMLLCSNGLGLSAVAWDALSATTLIASPSPTDWTAMTVVQYGFFVVGILVAAGAHAGRERVEVTVDAAIIGVALALLVWTFLVQPFLGSNSPDAIEFGTVVCLTVLDLLVLAFLVRSVIDRSLTAGPSPVLAAAAVVVLAVDLAYATRMASIGMTAFAPGGAIFAGWQICHALIGAFVLIAAAPPRSVSPPGTPRRPPGRGRLAIMAVLAFLTPIGTAVTTHRSPAGKDTTWQPMMAVAPAILTGALCLLLVVRVGIVARLAAAQAGALRAQKVLVREQSEALISAIGEQQVLHARLTRQALIDPLTGLANRRLFRQRLNQILSQPEPAGTLLLIDLDGFKEVNDTLGHPAGDRLLVEVGHRLSALSTEHTTVARLGGDEFAILDETDDVDRLALAHRILAALRQPFASIASQVIHVTATVGILVLRKANDEASALQMADIALYAAKSAGKDRAEIFHDGLLAAQLHRSRLSSELRTAVVADELTVAFQPIIDLRTGKVVSIEALSRWRREDGTVASPAEYITLAEQTGLIHEIGDHVLEQACRHGATWSRRHGVSIAVNVSAHQLHEEGYAERVFSVLTATGLPPSFLTLEVTESTIVGSGASGKFRLASDQLRRLRKQGVQVAVDDFGTGYSCLASLHTLPVDVVKLDRSFTALLDTDDNRGRFVHAIIELGLSLDLAVIAEGVETIDQHNRLRDSSCFLAQGYLFGRPMSGDIMATRLAHHSDSTTSSPVAIGHRHGATGATDSANVRADRSGDALRQRRT